MPSESHPPQKKIKLILIQNGIKKDSMTIEMEDLKKFVDTSKMFKKFVSNGIEIAIDEKLWMKINLKD